MGVGKTARPTWAIVWRDADGADQTALTLPVGRVISLFEPIMHGLQRQVCLALREGYRFRSSRAIDKTSRRYSRSQRYKSDGTGARIPLPAAVPSEGLWEVFGVAFQRPPFGSGFGKECLRLYLPGFIQAQCNRKNAIPPQGHSQIPLAARWRAILLRGPGILQQMIDIAFDLFHLGQQFGAGVLLQFQ